MRNSFIVKSDAARGDFYAGVTVFGNGVFRAVQLLGKDWWGPYNSGVHPWTTAAGENSTLLLFNYTNAAVRFGVFIETGGVAWFRNYQVAPLETVALDIGGAIADGVKDDAGHILPKNATAGLVHWFTLSPGQGAGRLLVTRQDIGLARSFQCQNTVAYCGSDSIGNTSVTLPVLGSVQGSGSLGPILVDLCFTTFGQCSGSQAQTAPASAYWTSTNAQVASTPSGLQTYPQITGVAAVRASMNAQVPDDEIWNPNTRSYYYCPVPPQVGTANVINSQMTTADVVRNTISVKLSGPSGVSGTLNLIASGNPTNSTILTQTLGPGTYNFSFGRPSLAVSYYSSVLARWTVSGATATGAQTVAFYGLGSTYFTTYNMPSEDKCSGGTSTAYICTSPSCNTYVTDQLNSTFISQTELNGTGFSDNHGTLKACAALNCAPPPGGTSGNHGNTLVSVSSATGACNTGLSDRVSVATNPYPNTSNQYWNCGDSVLLVDGSDQNNSTMTAADGCPACSTPGHIDSYSSSPACNPRAFGPYGQYTAIRLR